GVANRLGTAVGGKRNLTDAVIDAGRLDLGFVAAHPGDFRRGVDDGRHHVVVHMRFLAGKNLGHGYALFHALVRQHGATDDVAHGVDAGQAGAELLVDRDIAFFVEVDLGILGTQIVGKGATAHGDNQSVECRFLVLAVDAVGHLDVAAAGLGAGDARTELDVEPLFLERLERFRGDLTIGGGHEFVNRFQQRDVAAQARPDAAQLDADNAGADNTQAFRHAVELQGT